MRSPGFLFFSVLVGALLTGSFSRAQTSPAWQARHRLVWQGPGPVLQGHTTWTGPLKDLAGASELLLHLPGRALAAPQSALRKELLNYQLMDAHFAPDSARGYCRLSKLRLNGKTLPPGDTAGAFWRLPLPAAAPAGQVRLEVSYQLRLPRRALLQQGWQPGLISLVDYLPRIPVFADSAWQTAPVSYRHQRYLRRARQKVDIRLPARYEVVSNLPQRDSLSPGHYHFEGTARSLQLHASRQFHYGALPQGRRWVSHGRRPRLAALLPTLQEQVAGYFYRQCGDSLGEAHTILALPDKRVPYQSAGLLSLPAVKSPFELARALAHAQAQAAFRYTLHPHPVRHPWLAQGLPYYFQQHFVETEYPEERWVPYGDSWIGKLLQLDAFAQPYRNRFLYQFLARQGLAQALQTPADSLSRLNFEAVTQAKSFLALSHLRDYLSRGAFARGIRRYWRHNQQLRPPPDSLTRALDFFAVKPIGWFFDSLLPQPGPYDYRLVKTEHCATVSTATVKNTGQLAIPYSLTGYRDGKAVLTEWFAGHQGQKTVQLYHQEYDKVVLNAHLYQPEYNPRNNRVYQRSLFKRTEPLRFQFYNNFELPDATQIFYTPFASYNAYDKLLLGMQFSNASLLVDKQWEYNFLPEWSTGTGELTGLGSLVGNWVTPRWKGVRQISAGVFGRYYHYDRDLAYLRLSPGINFRLRKPYPRSPLLQNIRLRGVGVWRERPADAGPEARYNLADYQVAQLGYRLEKTAILDPTIFKVDLEYADKFAKAYASLDQRWLLFNKKWLIWRTFGGVFLRNDFLREGHKDNFYSFGLSARPDYLFDYQLFGRSDTSGVWARQFFVSDGGFKNFTGVRADKWMLTSSLTVPLYSVVGLYGDMGWADGDFYWGYGARLGLITDFAEVYFPLAASDRHYWQEPHYLSNVRFVLNIDIDDILRRFRRGLY
ncbi:MAG: hypothetical protein RI842_06560 [Schleiferiaceae bacterium]|nr:hypothetical protein [Schleiferiaceae bacterium]